VVDRTIRVPRPPEPDNQAPKGVSATLPDPAVGHPRFGDAAATPNSDASNIKKQGQSLSPKKGLDSKALIEGGGDFAFLVSGVFDVCNSILIKLGVVGQPL